MIVRSSQRWTKCCLASRAATNGRISLNVANMSNCDRSMSTVPLHLARSNNGMVNVLVKSTKVPRPSMIVPLKQKKKEGKHSPALVERAEAMPDHISYVGNERMPITSSLNIVKPTDDVPRGIWPVFRMMVR